MPALPTLLTDAGTYAAAAGLTYALTVLTVTLVSVASRDKVRRRDARDTLALLLRRRPSR